MTGLRRLNTLCMSAGFLYGWACVWIGTIPHITTRRHVRMLSYAAVATLAGSFVGASFAIACDAGYAGSDTYGGAEYGRRNLSSAFVRRGRPKLRGSSVNGCLVQRVRA